MKKMLFGLICLSLFGFAYADWTCRDFSAGKICLDLKYNGNGVYSIKKQFTKYTNKYTIELDCRILTPDGYLKEMGSCDGKFTYRGKGRFDISYYVNLEGERKILNTNYYFNPDASIDYSQDTSVIQSNNSTYNSNTSSSQSTYTSSQNLDQSSGRNGFTTSQLNDIKDVYNMWLKLQISLKNKYPRLASNSEWNNYANYIYGQMENFFYDRKSDINNYTDFKVMIVNFVRMTQNLR